MYFSIFFLIRDLRILDGVEKSSDKTNAVNLTTFESFLNNDRKIRFHFYDDKDSKTLKWRDLTGPEKSQLFTHINIKNLFPLPHNKVQVHKLWVDFLA